jgi:phosphatidylinositol glycan class Z
MVLLKWLWTEAETGSTPPELIYYILRGGMFILSFVLEDWAIYELVSSPRHRRRAVVLVASSYVTWTYQTHTFSNSLETLLVAWSLVLIQRILGNKVRSPPSSVNSRLLLTPNDDPFCSNNPPYSRAPSFHLWSWLGSSIESPSQHFS